MILDLSQYPQFFRVFLLRRLKEDLTRSSFFFTQEFLFHGKVLTISQCIQSLVLRKGRVESSLYIAIKHLIYNLRHLYWKDIFDHYRQVIPSLYLKFCGGIL